MPMVMSLIANNITDAILHTFSRVQTNIQFQIPIEPKISNADDDSDGEF